MQPDPHAPLIHTPEMVWGQADPATLPNVRHLFGQLGNADRELDDMDLNPYVVHPSFAWTQDCREPRLWLVGVDATQVTRIDRQNPMAPLTRTQVQSGTGLPAGAVRTQNRSALQVYVELQRGAGQHGFFMDANQWIETYSECVSMTLFAPASFYAVAPPNAQIGDPAAFVDLVADVLLGGSVWRIEESTGKHSVLFSQWFLTGETGITFVQVPPYAHSVTISQSGNSLAPANETWTQWYAPGGGGVPAGRIELINGQADTRILPNVSHLSAPSDLQRYSLVWEIRP